MGVLTIYIQFKIGLSLLWKLCLFFIAIVTGRHRTRANSNGPLSHRQWPKMLPSHSRQLSRLLPYIKTSVLPQNLALLFFFLTCFCCVCNNTHIFSRLEFGRCKVLPFSKICSLFSILPQCIELIYFPISRSHFYLKVSLKTLLVSRWEKE